MLTIDNIAEKLDFKSIGVNGVRLCAYDYYTEDVVAGSGITVKTKGQINRVWIEEDPVLRHLSTINGPVLVWMPYIYHNMDLTNLENDNTPAKIFYPGNGWDDFYFLGARADRICPTDTTIYRFDFFNVRAPGQGPENSVCYHPVGQVVTPDDPPVVQVTKYMNEWWHGVTNRNILPTRESPLSMHVYNLLYETGYESPTCKWLFTNGKPYVTAMHNADIKPYLDQWATLSLEEVLELQSQETSISNHLAVNGIYIFEDEDKATVGNPNGVQVNHVQLNATEQAIATLHAAVDL